METSSGGVFREAQLPALWANSGGPSSRTRQQSVRSTLLGCNRNGGVRCPRRMTLALDFGSMDPWKVMHEMLAGRGLDEPECIRALFTGIPGPMLCRTKSDLPALKVSDGPSEDILRQAFLLGLCTAVFYDPSRPVIWTRASLTRRLELFDTKGFYA